MRVRNAIVTMAVAGLFLGALAQEPQRPAARTGQRPAAQEDDKAIVNIKSKRMFPIKVADSTVYAFVGDVVAYHNGAVLLCDSAVRYGENRIECFDNVLINKDSTYVYGDRVEYDGTTNTAQVFSPLIKMIDGQAVLYTYHFKYNTLNNIGEFYGGGTMSQGQMLLESKRGYYYGETRDAVCVGDVELRDSTYRIASDSLGFNMDTEIATFYKRTYIWNDKNEILSANRGWYDTRTEHYHFMSDAYVLTEDQEVWADDMDYYSTTNDVEMRRNIQILDQEQAVLAFGDYGRYWGESGNAMLTEQPSVISFYDTQADSLYMRADSIFMYVIDSTSIYSADYIGNRKPAVQEDAEEELLVEEPLPSQTPASEPTESTESAEPSASVETPAVDGADSDATAPAADAPAAETVAASDERTSPGEEAGSETVGVADAAGAALDVADLSPRELRKMQREERRKERQAQREARRQAREEAIARREAELAPVQDTTAVTDSLPAADSLLTELPVQDTLTTAPPAEEEPERVILGYRNVKIYRSDMQAVCDSLIGFSRDTTIHLYREPVMWNGNNQIKSDTVVVYAKGDAIDRAVFTGGEAHGNPIMSAELDRSHYNQITGKEIVALFRDSEIYRTDVKGNAQTYYYMQDEATGAYQGFLVMECSDITFLIHDRDIESITFRGNPVYSIFPMDKIPESQEQRFQNFVWEGERRPAKRDVFRRRIRPSQRRDYEGFVPPRFPLTQAIEAYRQRILKDGIWRDRSDEITPDAREYIRRVEASQPVQLNQSTQPAQPVQPAQQ